MDELTHYEALGLPPDANEREIASAFRRAAAANHPDRGGDLAAFHRVREARDVLSDPAQRARYDEDLRAVASTTADVGEDWEVTYAPGTAAGDAAWFLHHDRLPGDGRTPTSGRPRLSPVPAIMGAVLFMLADAVAVVVLDGSLLTLLVGGVLAGVLGGITSARNGRLGWAGPAVALAGVAHKYALIVLGVSILVALAHTFAPKRFQAVIMPFIPNDSAQTTTPPGP